MPANIAYVLLFEATVFLLFNSFGLVFISRISTFSYISQKLIKVIPKPLLFLILALSLFTLSADASLNDSVVCALSDIDGRYREHNCNFTNINLDLRFVPKEGRVIGQESLLFSAIQPDVDSVYLDAPGILIHKLLLDNSAENVQYQSTKEGLIVRFPKQKLKWGEKHSIDIEYEATPRKGIYFIGWNDEKNLSRKQIWTQGQGIDNRHWFPCYDDVDDKVITSTTITFDSAYTVVSNGSLLSTHINADGSKTWHYEMNKPMAPYLVMVAIDKYAWKDYKSNNGITSRQYYYADHPEVETATYQYSKEVMDWLAGEIGVPYQWPSYANVPVQEFMYGAMENTSATIYGDFLQLDARGSMERPYLGVNAHELTHQWFGDYITEYSAPHHWLHESFATYYSKMFLRHIYGDDQYEWAKRGEANAALQADRENRYPIAHSKAGTARNYPKGSFVIGMLRYVLGEEVFRRSVQHYLHQHGLGNVDTHDFYRAFMETSGINLDWFFDEWIYHSGFPNFEVAYSPVPGATAFYVRQVQHTDSLLHIFRMPVVVEVDYTDGSRDTVRSLLSRAADTLYVPNTKGRQIAFTLFDPGFQILKTVATSKTYGEWLAQARGAQHMIDRYDAVFALRDTAIGKKRTDLISLFEHEKYFAIRSEIVGQLKKDVDNKKTAALFRLALKDPDFNVRRAVVDGLDSIPRELLPECEALLADSSFVTIENTFRKLCKNYPQYRQKYFDRLKNTIGVAKNVRIALLELESADHPAEPPAELLDYTSHSYEFRTRVKAMEALERLGYGDERLFGNLFEAILSANGRLSNPAAKTLKKLIEKSQLKEMALACFHKNNWQDWQKDILDRVLEVPAK